MRERMRNRQSSLIRAVQRCNLSHVRTLIASGADVNACDPEGHTALMQASAKGRTGIVRLLLAHSADSGIEASYPHIGWASAISLAAHGGHLNVIHVLLARNGKPTCPKWNCPRKALRILPNKNSKRRLLYRDDHRYYSEPPFLRFVAFVHAAQGKRSAAVAILRPYADYGLHIHKIATNWFIHAVENDDVDAVKLWLDLGVEIDAPTTWGQGETALIAAAQYGNVAMVRLLLSRGADVHAKTGYGYSVFDALEPPPDHLRLHTTLYEHLLSLQPAYEEIRRLLHEHIALPKIASDEP